MEPTQVAESRSNSDASVEKTKGLQSLTHLTVIEKETCEYGDF